MELRHLRYFVAVAEEGSMTLAAERRLHTAQPSLSRQIRDLELEVGTKLISRSTRGVVLTDAGRVFLDHARRTLAQVEAATVATRRAARPDQTQLALGFLSGCEPEWLPAVKQIMATACPGLEIAISSMHSPQLADALVTGRLDAAVMRAEEGHAELEYTLLNREPLIAVLPRDHRLASCATVSARDLVGETFIGMADQAPVLRTAIERYLRRSGVDVAPAHRVEYLSMAMSLVASTHGVALLPDFARNFLTRLVVSRPLAGDAPSIDLVLGYHKANRMMVLRMMMARIDEIVRQVTGR